MTLEDVRARLEVISEEMKEVIRRYGLSATSPLGVMENAKSQITSQDDYVRFLELSLEGRILADEGERLMKAEKVLRPTVH